MNGLARSSSRHHANDPRRVCSRGAKTDYVQRVPFYPGLYCPSGFDFLKIMYHIATRPNPVIQLGPVDGSCPIVLCDLLQPDVPVVYVSPSFLQVTGYSQNEVLGRNCRFLQHPPPKSMAPPPLPHYTSDGSMHSAPSSRSSSASSESESSESSASSVSSVHSGHVPRMDPSPYVSPEVRQVLHHAVATNQEVQVTVPNFRRDGTPWENVLTIVPIYWDDDASRQPRTHRYSVGFVCDQGAMGFC